MRPATPRMLVLSAALAWAAVMGIGDAQGRPPKAREREEAGANQEVAQGRRLFLRSWVPDDPKGRGGDGLGPVFNARSCVACHGLGGPGGGGTNRVNVELLSAVPTRRPSENDPRPLDRTPLIAIHPAFAQSGGIVLHRFGLAPSYPAWRERARTAFTRTSSDAGGEVAPPDPEFNLVVSERNSPALFGAGILDRIPDAAIEAEAGRQVGRATAGRIGRLKDGRVGRFGWKAQVAGLEDFVLTACANELGLEVPGHHQAPDPLGFGDRQRPGLDMSGDDCRALVAYVASLPAPDERASLFPRRGRAVFAKAGCADCHRPDLEGARGIYSDLLLHDMGPGLTDAGVYYGQDEESSPGVPKSPEWRTPPLWGVADSAPYLHDGRARTIDEAIRRHGGQAKDSAARYNALSSAETVELLGFLRSLRVHPSARTSALDLRLAREEFLPFTPRPSLPLPQAMR